ncbi:MAG TPA: hypothetical protein VFC93_04330 [Chloroflexota bacterium]|jgi:hypothetical protein|nr:hypothetical protein [Chloroflexota bacterium]
MAHWSFRPLGLARAAAVGAVVAASLAGATTAGAASDDPPLLDHQVAEHLLAGQAARFRFTYGGPGDVAEIVILPARDGAQLDVRVLGPDEAPVEVYGQAAGKFAIKDDVVTGEAGIYTVEVTNRDQAAVDFLIDEDEAPSSGEMPTNTIARPGDAGSDVVPVAGGG